MDLRVVHAENGRFPAGKLYVHIVQEYDVVFKLILQSVDLTIREIGGPPVVRWLNVELPEVRNTRADLLGETAAGELIHIELQSANDPDMPLRMAEYCLRVRRNFRRFRNRSWFIWGTRR
jgi:predicted transposase YdaD